MNISSVKSKSEIQKLKNSRYKLSNKFFICITANLEVADGCKYLLIVTKKIGNAVVRNTIKRKLRALIRKNSYLFREGFGYLFIAKKPLIDSNNDELTSEFVNLIKKYDADQ